MHGRSGSGLPRATHVGLRRKNNNNNHAHIVGTPLCWGDNDDLGGCARQHAAPGRAADSSILSGEGRRSGTAAANCDGALLLLLLRLAAETKSNESTCYDVGR
jgi:hypothetical protein